MWKQILLQNRDNVLAALQQCGAKLSAVHVALRDGNEAELGTSSSPPRRRTEMLWEVDIYPADGQPDLLGRAVAAAAADWGWPAT